MAKETKTDGWDKLAPYIVVVGAFFVSIWVWLGHAGNSVVRLFSRKKRRN
jgi:hypothetical protein